MFPMHDTKVLVTNLSSNINNLDMDKPKGFKIIFLFHPLLN